MKKICEIKLPPSVKFSTDHQWVSTSAPYRLGVSDYIQDQLGPLIFVDLPAVGAELRQGDEYAAVESDKRNCPLAAPVSGKVTAVNDALSNDPTVINHSPYNDGWIIELELQDPDQMNCLMTANEYLGKIESGTCK